MEAFVESVGVLSPLYFVLLFVVAGTGFVPVALLSLASGALFGPWYGTLFTLCGATGAATLSFLAGRFLGQRLAWAKYGRVETVVSRVRREGWKAVALMRLFPVLPFALLNMAFGLSGIGLAGYAVSTFVFMAPVRFAYAYAGDVGWEAFLSGDAGRIVLVLLLAAALFVVSRMRSAG